jgi:hypothetical protein
MHPPPPPTHTHLQATDVLRGSGSLTSERKQYLQQLAQQLMLDAAEADKIINEVNDANMYYEAVVSVVCEGCWLLSRARVCSCLSGSGWRVGPLSVRRLSERLCLLSGSFSCGAPPTTGRDLP